MAFLFAPYIDAQAETATDLKCRGCVGSGDIARSAITKKKIAKRAVVPSRLKAPTGAAGTEPADATSSITGNQIVASISVDIPRKGVLVVNTSGYFRFDSSNGEAECAITTGVVTEEPLIRATGSTTQADERAPFAGTRAFVEGSGGVKTYNLVCSPGAGDDVTLWDVMMTAIYAPTNILTTP
jgi:hypothetical protein